MSSSVLIELGLQDTLESPVVAFELLFVFRSILVIVRLSMAEQKGTTVAV